MVKLKVEKNQGNSETTKSWSQKASETTNTELPNGPFSKVKINKKA